MRHPPGRLAAGAEPDRVVREIEEIIGLDCSNIIKVRCATAPRPCTETVQRSSSAALPLSKG